MSELAVRIEEAARREGIDLVGFAPRERFADVDAAHNPFSIFPDGKTVIMLGKRICRGSLRGVEEGTNFNDYSAFGVRWLEDEFLALACYNMTRVLEDDAWEAVPVYPNPPEIPPTGVAVREGEPAPNVFPDFDYCAVAAGLAEISYLGLATTPQFGTRARFHMIITDAELPATPLLGKKVCDGCKKCAAICPLGAFRGEKTVTVCGIDYTVADIDLKLCEQCKNGAIPNRLHPAGKPDRVAALCARTCLCHLEEEKLVGNLFENGFRRREAWALDRDGNYAGAEAGGCRK